MSVVKVKQYRFCVRRGEGPHRPAQTNIRECRLYHYSGCWPVSLNKTGTISIEIQNIIVWTNWNTLSVFLLLCEDKP